ncbi:MAG: hypothetical protein NXH97_12480 [Rhodobacteraceae bacterium]|nr:hypothetical protein [Paracoccaceae bacterium]
MATRTKKPKNRFLPGAHVSEATLARVLYCWLNGELYTNIPDAIQRRGGAVDAAMDQLREMMGEKFTLAENNKTTVSRQACHSIIAEISLKVIVRAYKDRIARLDELLNGDDPLQKAERRRVVAIIGHEPSDEEKAELLEKMRGQSVEDFITRWGKIVLILSANVVPYEAMRAIPGVKPFDLIQNPIILEKMQARYRAFRGYKIHALKTHVAHHRCLEDGSRQLARFYQIENHDDHHTFSETERRAYWQDLVVHSTALLCLKLFHATSSQKKSTVETERH